MSARKTSSVSGTPVLSRKAQTALKLLMVLVGPLLLLTLFEGVAFFWEKNQAQGPFAWEMVASRRIELVPHSGSGTVFMMMKPGMHYEWQNIRVDINSHGLRDEEIRNTKPDGTYRILNLGDSIAMGWGVKLEDTYGKKLEALLNRQANTGLRYEVINAAVPGWGVDSELAFLQTEGVWYEPDMVLLDLTIVNDIYVGSGANNDRRPTFEWLRDHTYFWPFLTVQYQQIKTRAQGKERIPVLDPPADPSYYFPQSPQDEAWDVLYSYIAQIYEVTSARNIPFVMILFPIEHQVVDSEFPRIPQIILTERAKNDNIPVVDLLPVFEEACISKPGGECILEDRYLFADLWMHPSILGNQIAAESLFSSIIQKYPDQHP